MFSTPMKPVKWIAVPGALALCVALRTILFPSFSTASNMDLRSRLVVCHHDLADFTDSKRGFFAGYDRKTGFVGIQTDGRAPETLYFFDFDEQTGNSSVYSGPFKAESGTHKFLFKESGRVSDAWNGGMSGKLVTITRGEQGVIKFVDYTSVGFIRTRGSTWRHAGPSIDPVLGQRYGVSGGGEVTEHAEDPSNYTVLTQETRESAKAQDALVSAIMDQVAHYRAATPTQQELELMKYRDDEKAKWQALHDEIAQYHQEPFDTNSVEARDNDYYMSQLIKLKQLKAGVDDYEQMLARLVAQRTDTQARISLLAGCKYDVITAVRVSEASPDRNAQPTLTSLTADQVDKAFDDRITEVTTGTK